MGTENLLARELAYLERRDKQSANEALSAAHSPGKRSCNDEVLDDVQLRCGQSVGSSNLRRRLCMLLPAFWCRSWWRLGGWVDGGT
jgi:hypothetical protein